MSTGESDNDDSQRVQPLGFPMSTADILLKALQDREEEARKADENDPLPIPPIETTGPAEYATCVRPRDALTRFPYSTNIAITQLFRELAVRRIVAVADQAIICKGDGTSVHHYPIVPVWVWSAEIQEERDFWDTGFFERSLPARSYDFRSDRWIKLYDVRFWPEGLPVPASVEKPAPQDATIARGRKAATWWPAFSEELAVYIHENGIPDGSGSDGQGDLIAAILQRLSDRGVEASRTSIQPTVQAVLNRLRSAGK